MPPVSRTHMGGQPAQLPAGRPVVRVFREPKPFEQLSLRSQRRLTSQWRILSQSYPDYTWQQYLAERQAGSVQPTSRKPERRIPESIKQRPGGGSVFYTTEQLGEFAYQNLYNQVGPGGGIRPGSIEQIQQAQTIEHAVAAGQNPSFYGGWNDQAVRYNIAQLVSANDRQALADLISADAETIRYNAHVSSTILNKGGNPRSFHWFYKGDIFQVVSV